MSKVVEGVGGGFAPPSSLGVAGSLMFYCCCSCYLCCCVARNYFLNLFCFVFPNGLCCVSIVLEVTMKDQVA